jgi:hypothetical protein
LAADPRFSQVGGVGKLPPLTLVQCRLSLNKRFAIYENLSVEFQAEAYNAFHHTNFALPPGGIADITNSNTFGVITSTAAPRVMQFSLRLDF